MKKSTLILFALFCATLTQAQTINAPVLEAGDHFTYAATDLIPVGEAGENMVWDYTSLGVTQNFNGQFLPAIPSPFQDDYPNAEWIWEMAGGQYYYNLGPDMFEYFGGVEGGASYPYLDSEEFYPYPFNYEQTHADTSINDVTIMGMAYERTVITNTAIDGYGTLNLPNGVVYDDVCRIRVYREITDVSIAGTSSVIIDQTTFVQNGLAAHIVSHSDIEVNQAGSTQEFNVLEYLVSYTTNVDEPQAQDLEFAMYPNPSSDDVMLRWAMPVEAIVVYDLTGREVDRVVSIPGLGMATLDVSDWTPGAYTVSFINGKSATSQKILVE